MKANLDAIRSEIQAYLETRGLAVFHGHSRNWGDVASVYWNTSEHPDFRTFIEVAEKAGVRMITIYSYELSESVIDNALDRLDDPTLPRDERRRIERRLRELRAFAGFTSQVEISFDMAPRVYIFDLRTEWFDELNEILHLIDAVLDEGEPEEEPPGGYFSQN